MKMLGELGSLDFGNSSVSKLVGVSIAGAPLNVFLACSSSAMGLQPFKGLGLGFNAHLLGSLLKLSSLSSACRFIGT